MKIFVLFLKVTAIVVGAVILLMFILGVDPSGSEKTETYAIIYAEQAIEGHLKSPSTADFSGGRSTVTKDVDTFYVKGYVDAQNGFGATVRNDYEVKVMFVGDKIKTSILSFE